MSSMSTEFRLRLADAYALLVKAPHDEDGVPVVPASDHYDALFSALHCALRGDPGCIEPREWQEQRHAALDEYAEYLGI